MMKLSKPPIKKVHETSFALDESTHTIALFCSQAQCPILKSYSSFATWGNLQHQTSIEPFCTLHVLALGDLVAIRETFAHEAPSNIDSLLQAFGVDLLSTTIHICQQNCYIC
jgi:hypothetical protein